MRKPEVTQGKIVHCLVILNIKLVHFMLTYALNNEEPLEIIKIKFYIKNYKAMYNFSLSYF